jgi:UDP-glucose:(heptosyl)LPS alpha-1,3-glucosyltransferase
MRIALVIERFEPRGGAEQVAWHTAHGLARAGDEVTVIARRASPAARVPVERVACPETWQPARVLAFSRAAARAGRRGGYDLVYSLSRTRHQDVVRAGAGSHADYLERRHAGAALALRRLSPRHASLLWLEAGALRDPRQLVVCGSEMVRGELCARYDLPSERTALVRNGVDLERFHPRLREGEGARLRSALDGEGQPVWLFAGSGFARKGLDTALRSLRRVPGARLWVAGADAPRRWQRLAERLGVAGRVRFLGFRDDVAALYAAADGLLLPTRYDACANACLEAAACGTPVVTSGANGAAELLAGAGRRVEDPEDAGAFADALAELADPALRRRLGEAARRAVLACGWDDHVARLRALFAAWRGRA